MCHRETCRLLTACMTVKLKKGGKKLVRWGKKLLISKHQQNVLLVAYYNLEINCIQSAFFEDVQLDQFSQIRYIDIAWFMCLICSYHLNYDQSHFQNSLLITNDTWLACLWPRRITHLGSITITVAGIETYHALKTLDNPQCDTVLRANVSPRNLSLIDRMHDC